MGAVVACATCGTQLRPNAKFCDECGAATTASPRLAEYKQVTVLFTDVVHSMDIAAAVGAERFREIIDDTRGCVADRIGDCDLQVAGVLDIECLHHTCSPKGSRHQLTSDEPSRAVRWDTEQDVEHSRYRVSSCRKSRAALM